MQGDDPPYLSVGTAVSAKYKGAFCEAKVSKVVRIVKCKVTYKMGLGTAAVNDDCIKGTLRVGQLVQAKHPERKEYFEATITKVQDCSQYTVVFDDGDITTLRRTALCLKSGRHFNESETLDQLPLTHPEHFGNPVMGGRRGRRSRQLKESSSEGEGEEENEPDLEQYSADAGKVVMVESTDKKRGKDSWFPGLIVMPSAQPTVRINVKDEFLVRSFKDGRYYTVPKKEVHEFKRESGSRGDADTVDKVIKYLDHDELPIHWERDSLFNVQTQYSDSDENFSDSSDDEPTEEKDHFVAQLYKFMDDSGTPLNKTPTIGSKDVDLYRLFRLVQKLGGYNRVTNQTKWKSIAAKLKFSQSQNTYNQVKQVYKKCLLSYEAFYRTLGCTMLNHTRSSKKNRGRPLIRDKDRVTPVQSPRPEKPEEEPVPETKAVEEDNKLKPKRLEKKIDEEKKRKEQVAESSDTSSDATDQSEQQPSTSKDTGRPKRTEIKPKETKRAKPAAGEKVKALVEKFEEQSKRNTEREKEKEKEKEKEEEKEKVQQQTRSKAQVPKTKVVVSPEVKSRETKTPVKETKESKELKEIKPAPKIIPKKEDEEKDKDKKRGRKRTNTDDKMSSSDSSVPEKTVVSTSSSQHSVNIGDKLKVYYGPTHESKVTYEAKVIEFDIDPTGNTVYLVHYTGWNNRYDEWINVNRIAENLSATTKAKRLKQGSSASKSSSNKPPVKRGRGMSITGRSTVVSEIPRSTTPSSVTSSSSRTKSPATPARHRTTRQGDSGRHTRRTSAQTDVSVHSDSDTDDQSGSDTEPSRTRSITKSEDADPKTYRRKLVKTKGDKRKDDDETEKEEEPERPKRTRKLKKLSDIKGSDDSDDDTAIQPKGREFDLNQIRSELKGFGKVMKVTSTDTSEKETVSSDESTTPTPDNVKDNVSSEAEPCEDKKEDEKLSSSDDIYEFKEPEPFEFEVRKIDDKSKKRITRLYDDVEKSPPKKKSPKSSPIKPEVKEPEKKFKRSPVKKVEEIEENDDDEDDDQDEDSKSEPDRISDDPFDKLVESPSFHSGKSTLHEKSAEKQAVTKVLNMDEPLSIFELPEAMEENSEDRLELSDNEERQEEVSFTHISPLFLHSNFGKPSPEHISDNACDTFTTKLDDTKQKDSEEDDDDPIKASIQRVIAQTDEESNDVLLETEVVTYETKSPPPEVKEVIPEVKPESESEDVKEEIIKEPSPEPVKLSKKISPVFQETDSLFLERLYSSPQFTTKVEDLKDINVKKGTTIADTLLQKLTKQRELKSESPEPPDVKTEEIKVEIPIPIPVAVEVVPVEVKPTPIERKSPEIPLPVEIEEAVKSEEENEPPKEEEVVEVMDFKKRSTSRKFVSREFIEDTDSDSDSDAEQRLVIARSDDDSQTSTSSDTKPDAKDDGDDAVSNTAQSDESQPPMEIEERNFKLEDIIKDEPKPEEVVEKVVEDMLKCEEVEMKEEEPDSHLHSMLLCEETIPGSPAPAPPNEPKAKSVLEMPFASAPSSSNSKSIVMQQEKNKDVQPVAVPLVMPLDNREAAREVSTVLDNTPPTTPESTISNLSPRGDIGGLSPANGDNESCKSLEVENDYTSQRRSASNKPTPYSEDDSLLNNEPQSSTKKTREEIPSPCKKRRRSCKGENEVPVKRGRKPNRSRHNSDSDDTSEHSMQGIVTGLETRVPRSPRPSKYNFFVELDPSLDSATRIAVLQQKLQDLRKTYADVKAELVVIERRRKKIRRREREALKAAKQEMSCI